eukprot:SAG31_NODE_44829_length_261_cov_0.641975_1_plen_42_part_01
MYSCSMDIWVLPYPGYQALHSRTAVPHIPTKFSRYFEYPGTW